MNDVLNVLCLEDSPRDAEIIRELLIDAGYDLKMDCTAVEKKFVSLLRSHRYDIILADFKLPGFDGFAALRWSVEICPNVPFICISGTIGEETAVELLKQGASDYVMKDRMGRLPSAIQRALQEVKEKQALRKSEEKFRNLVENTLTGIFITNLQGELLFANIAFCKMLEFDSVEEFKNYGVSRTYWNQEDRAGFIGQLRKSKRLVNHELVLKTKTGNQINIILSAYLEEDRITGTVIDITERKRMEETLKESLVKVEAADRLKTAFIHNISHELRTPLNGILGFSSLITQPDITDEEKENFSSLIKVSSNRLLNTISNYMDISMIFSGTMEVYQKPFDLHRILHTTREQFQPICAVKQLDLILKIPNETGSFTLHSDVELFSKALSHLLDNAVKFTNQGEITFGYIIKPGVLEFFVKDTGTGVSNEACARIFASFEQEELSHIQGYEGSGLGLSIAQGLIRLLGGEIRVESEKDAGSIFFFTIPFEEKLKEVTRPKEKEIQIQIPERPVILIAEDEESNIFYLETLLRKANITIFTAVNGKKAVDQCREHPEISLVLMDIKMPVMNGFEATREIKSFRKDILVIAVTAFAMKGDEKKAMEAGCDDYLAKPVDKDSLMNMLAKYGYFKSTMI